MSRKQNSSRVARYASMLSALGAEPRLRIVRLLLSAHPQGMVVNEIASELKIPNSTLSHYLEKLKINHLVNVRREGTFLWYSANDELLQELVAFLYEECCTRGVACSPAARGRAPGLPRNLAKIMLKHSRRGRKSIS
ncbi:MAG TPA: metalloregulator ArsR/SmtB family transcription factor [Candidatus Acidoferrales bacterium]|nr:metalloregulator ArsR/SmtB family transcription factor [Candidatus Acidoferrales bacterium]